MKERTPVYAVSAIDVETMKKRPPGYRITAKGTVRTSAWSNGRLEARIYVTPPADGYQDLDFTAQPPDGISNPVITPLTSEPLVIDPAPDWIKGFRIHAETNTIEKSV